MLLIKPRKGKEKKRRLTLNLPTTKGMSSPTHPQAGTGLIQNQQLYRCPSEPPIQPPYHILFVKADKISPLWRTRRRTPEKPFINHELFEGLHSEGISLSSLSLFDEQLLERKKKGQSEHCPKQCQKQTFTSIWGRPHSLICLFLSFSLFIYLENFPVCSHFSTKTFLRK